MQNKIIIGLLALAFMASAGMNIVLLQKVAQQDKQLKPVKAQQTAQARQAALRQTSTRRRRWTGRNTRRTNLPMRKTCIRSPTKNGEPWKRATVFRR